MAEPTLHTVELLICSLCLGGAGGECHTPGCALWLNRAPDIAILVHPCLSKIDGQAAPAYWAAADISVLREACARDDRSAVDSWIAKHAKWLERYLPDPQDLGAFAECVAELLGVTSG